MFMILAIIAHNISTLYNLLWDNCACYCWFQKEKAPFEELHIMSTVTHGTCVLMNTDLTSWHIIWEIITFSSTQKNWWYLTKRKLRPIMMKDLPHRNFRLIVRQSPTRKHLMWLLLFLVFLTWSEWMYTSWSSESDSVVIGAA